MTKQEFREFLKNPLETESTFSVEYEKKFGKPLVDQGSADFVMFNHAPRRYQEGVARYAVERGRPFNSATEIAVELFGYDAKEFEAYVLEINSGKAFI